jgi:hypothetical protein
VKKERDHKVISTSFGLKRVKQDINGGSRKEKEKKNCTKESCEMRKESSWNVDDVW